MTLKILYRFYTDLLSVMSCCRCKIFFSKWWVFGELICKCCHYILVSFYSYLLFLCAAIKIPDDVSNHCHKKYPFLLILLFSCESYSCLFSVLLFRTSTFLITNRLTWYNVGSTSKNCGTVFLAILLVLKTYAMRFCVCLISQFYRFGHLAFNSLTSFYLMKWVAISMSLSRASMS